MILVFLPFSKRAKGWETHGLDLRRIACVKTGELLDPWTLAPRIGLHVFDGAAALALLPPSDASLLRERVSAWSGGVYRCALPDGSYLCILNPDHPRRRNRITLMEEICHTHLKHHATKVTLQENGLRVRDYDANQEADAYGVGAAALLPWSTFFGAINSGMSVASIAEKYDVTTQLVEYRVKTSGAYSLFRKRQLH